MTRQDTFRRLVRIAFTLVFLCALTVPAMNVGAAPSPQATPRPPAGEPWIGDIRFGYDPNGGDGVGDGGTLPIKELGTVLASFAWRNIPPGSTFTVETYMDEYPPRRIDAVMNQPQGQTRFAVARLGAVDGGEWASTGVTLTVYLNGKEMASAHVILK